MNAQEINNLTALLPRRALPIDIYCGIFGDTRDAIKKRLQRGHWLQGKHVLVPEGVKTQWVNLEAVDEWALKNCRGV